MQRSGRSGLRSGGGGHGDSNHRALWGGALWGGALGGRGCCQPRRIWGAKLLVHVLPRCMLCVLCPSAAAVVDQQYEEGADEEATAHCAADGDPRDLNSGEASCCSDGATRGRGETSVLLLMAAAAVARAAS